MNPGPAPRPPVAKPRLNLMPSTVGRPGNGSQVDLSNMGSIGSQDFGGSRTVTPYLTRVDTKGELQGMGKGGVAILKEGPARIKEGLLWKSRRLVLRSFQLEILKGNDGKVASLIQLKDVTGVSRSETVRLAFEIVRVADSSTAGASMSLTNKSRDSAQKTTLVQLESDDEIYEWIDAIYNRCPGMGGVSNPTNFHHRIHVGFDPTNGNVLLLRSAGNGQSRMVSHPVIYALLFLCV